jgi:hypothetical protein
MVRPSNLEDIFVERTGRQLGWGNREWERLKKAEG